MTAIIRKEVINGYEIELRQEDFEAWYTVYIFTPYGTTYRKSNPQIGWKRATATYRRYRREVKERLA